MSVTLRIGDVGRRLNLYWNIPILIKTANYPGPFTTNSTSYVRTANGSISLPGFTSKLRNFYDSIRIEYSFLHKTSGGSSSAYLKLLGINGPSELTTSTTGEIESNSVDSDMPSDGIVTWELWQRTNSSSYTSTVQDLTLKLNMLNKNKTTITAFELDVGQLYLTGYRLDTRGVVFYLDDDALYSFYNPGGGVLVETFNTPVQCNKITIQRGANDTAITYLIVV